MTAELELNLSNIADKALNCLKSCLEKKDIKINQLCNDTSLIMDGLVDISNIGYYVDLNTDDELINDKTKRLINEIFNLLRNSKDDSITFCELPTRIFEPYLTIVKTVSDKYSVCCSFIAALGFESKYRVSILFFTNKDEQPK
jgi:hypothetical protein